MVGYRPRAVIHLESGETFPSIGEAARQTGFSRTHISRLVNQGEKWCYCDGQPPDRPFSRRIVLCVDTGQVFPTLKAAATAYQVSTTTLSDYIHRQFPCRGKRFTFIDRPSA